MNNIKTNIIGLAAFILFTASCTFAQNADIPDEQSDYGDSVVTMDTFRDKLTSSGQWMAIDSNDIDADAIHADPNAPDNNRDNQMDNNNQSDNEDYGYDDNINKDICWRPDGVDYDWNPYSCGYWSYTNCGWMWNSCDNWGWYTCHYGRWWWSVRWGWVWSPGYVWAPCWVSWNYCNGYIGWYPLSPRLRCRGHFRYDISHYHFRQNNWTFVETKNFTSTITTKNIVKIEKGSNVLDGSKVVNNIYVAGNKVINKGPNVREIEKSTGTKVTTENVNKYTVQNKNYTAKQSGEKSEIKNATVDNKRNRNNNTGNNEKGYRPNKNDGNKNNGNKNNGTYGNKGNRKSKDGNGNTFKRGNHSRGNNSPGKSHSHSNGSSKNGSKSKGSKHKK